MMEEYKISKPFMFQRQKGGKQPKPSIFTKTWDKYSSSSIPQDKNSIFSHLGEVNEIRSSVLSHMKCVSTLDVKTNGTLKVKRCTLVVTSCEANSNSKEKFKENGQASLSPSQFGRLKMWRMKLNRLKHQKFGKVQKASKMV